MRRALLAAALGLTVTACGRPDASGVYLTTADGRITMIQLTQTPDGTVSGRMEEVSIGPGGIVSDQSTALDGAAAKRDLAGLKARRSTPEAYQAALTRLQSRAAAERRQAADAQAVQAERAAQSASIGDAADKAVRLQAATVELRTEAEQLNAGVDKAPDFGAQSAEATRQLAELAQRAPGLSGGDRVQAVFSANRIISGANQIAVARSQYAVPLNRIVQQGSPLATEVQRFCGSAQGEAFARACGPATAAATDFQSAVVRGVTVFNGYKHAIQDDLARQNRLVQKIGG